MYDSSLLDTHAGVTEPTGGDDAAGAVGEGATGGQSNPAEGGKGGSTNGSGGGASVGNGGSSANGGAGNVSNGGDGSDGGKGSAAGAASNGGNTGSAGAGSTGSAGAGSTGAGGSGSAAGAPTGGSAGAGGAPINPCNRTNWKATASSSSTNPSTPPAKAIDGVLTTRWSTGAVQVGGEWFLVDLGARAAHLTQIVLEASGNPGDEPLKYKVEASSDGKTYTLVCTGTGAPTTVIKFADTPARYIRITQTGSDPDANWWSIQELTLTCSPN